MQKMLKRLLIVLAILSIPAGLFIKHEHAVFLWHKIPSINTLFGFLGAMLLIVGARLLAHLIQREEDFYD
jgi:hypothetical protein